MRKILRVVVLAVVFCFLPGAEARAGINSNAWIWYYEATNTEWGIAHLSPDYYEQAYYHMYIEVWLGAEGVGGNGDSDMCITGIGMGCTDVWAEVSLPHDPNAEYEVWSAHTVEVIPQENSNYYYDYFGYSAYHDPYDPLYYPQSYYFLPAGSSQINFSYILLGHLIGVASGGTMHGPPHHLKVVLDRYEDTDCGSKRRLIRFQPVDSAGRFAGRVKVKETFQTISGGELQSIRNECQGNNYSPGGCLIMTNNYFTDQLWVGCPSAGGDCGTDPPIFISRWWWCPQGGSGNVSLSANVYSAAHHYVAVNGRETPYAPGTELR